VKPWEFQDDKSDVVWRYTKTQASYLSRKKMLPSSIDIY
jgi:translation initiation factor 1A